MSSSTTETPCEVGFTVDLASAARRNVFFFRTVAETQWLHENPTIFEAIRRYDELWMPLISDLTVDLNPPLILPPIDVEWVWYCHRLNPVSYRKYCKSRFSKLISRPTIFNEDIEEYALMRCRDYWIQSYPSEPFENQSDSKVHDSGVRNQDILKDVMKQRALYTKFSEPYMSETVYLIAATRRYKGFLNILHRVSGRLVPAQDIMLMWLTHQCYPQAYSDDTRQMEDDLGKVVSLWESVNQKVVEESKKLWEEVFNQPYDIAGGGLAMDLDGAMAVKKPIYLEDANIDFNTRYKSMVPRFLLEVCVSVRLDSKMMARWKDKANTFLRLRVIRCHRELKIDKHLSEFSYESWKICWHLYSEFRTRGILLELRHSGGHCFRGSRLLGAVSFSWNDLLRSPSLTLQEEIEKQVSVVASITPPVQTSYLLKCVPDRVSDDSGAMISDVVLKMNGYRPQEGRWLSRTVLDHAGRECFVVRVRVGGGFWRRGGETLSLVKWEDRIIEIREGSWTYIAGSIGRAPVKVIGTATPKEPPEQWNVAWYLSTGDELMIRWEASKSMSSLTFCLKNQTSASSWLNLLKGRRMQFKVRNVSSGGKNVQNQNIEEYEEKGEDDDEDGFVTLVRCTEENPTGRATALLNWKLLVVELLPGEDAVLVLLLCVAMLRSISGMRNEDVGGLLVRRRLKEAKVGYRDWGSVILDPRSSSSTMSSPNLQPWYQNANLERAIEKVDYMNKQPASNYSPVEGGDKLYKRGIITT